MRLAAYIGIVVLGLLGLVGYRIATMGDVYDPYSPEALAEQAAEDSLSAQDSREIQAEMDSVRAAGPAGEPLGTYAMCGERCTGARSGMKLVLMPEHPRFEGVYVGYAPPNACLGSTPLRWSQGREGTVTLEYPGMGHVGTSVEVVVTETGLSGVEVFSGIHGEVSYKRFVGERLGPPEPDACGLRRSSS